MILKFLVVIWFLKMLVDTFFKDKMLRDFCKSSGETFNKIGFNNDSKIKALSDESKRSIVYYIFIFLFVILFKIFIFVIDFIMMLCMLKYDNTYITTIFIALSIIHLMCGLIKGKLSSIKDKKNEKRIGDSFIELSEELNKITFRKFILRIINILYWGYALLLLFF